MFKRFPFKTKIILAQNLIILSVIIIIGIIYYQKVASNMSENILEDFKVISDSIVNQFDYACYNLDRTALQIAANPDIVSEFKKIDGKADTNYFAEEPLRNAEIVELLNSYNFKKDGIKRICLYNQHHDFVYTATDVTTYSGINKWLESEDFKIIQKYFETGNHYIYYGWFPNDIFNDTGVAEKAYFSVVRQIKNHITNENVYGYVEVQENVKWLDNMIENGDGNTYVVLLQENDVLYMNALLDQREDKNEMKEKSIQLRNVLENKEVKRIDGYFVYKRTLKNAPYEMIFMKEKDSELSFFNQYNTVMLASFILILLTAVITEMIIVRKLSKPLEQLDLSIKNMTLDNPQLEAEEWKNNDEFVRIQYAFSAMIQRMKEAMEREYASEANELKAQLFALQSQMNPHFLYNILAIISIEAQDNDIIPNMCMRLRRMLNYGSHMGDGFSQIKNEVEYALDYMELMKVRYEDLFIYQVDGNSSLYSIRIPKYIIQPICENSFNHSFKNTEPVWKIRIFIYEKNGKWMIEIHDNGIGFSEEYLEEFNKKAEEFCFSQMRNTLKDISIGGMGIWNIYMRMKISYENDFVFRLFNDEEGAVVLIGGMLI